MSIFATKIVSNLCYFNLCIEHPNSPLPRSKNSFIQKLQLKQCKHCSVYVTYRYKLSKEIVPSSGRLSLIFHFHLCMTESDPLYNIPILSLFSVYSTLYATFIHIIITDLAEKVYYRCKGGWLFYSGWLWRHFAGRKEYWKSVTSITPATFTLLLKQGDS